MKIGVHHLGTSSHFPESFIPFLTKRNLHWRGRFLSWFMKDEYNLPIRQERTAIPGKKEQPFKRSPPPTSSNRVNICFFWASAVLCVYFYYRDLFVCMCLSLGCLTLGQAQVVSHWRFHKVMKWWDGGVCLGESSICHCFVIVLMVGGQVKYLTYILCASDDIHAGSVVAASLQPHGL